MSYTVSHVESGARDQAVMDEFYTEIMGFIVSDRGIPEREGAQGRSPKAARLD
jgi:hypothetical protein